MKDTKDWLNAMMSKEEKNLAEMVCGNWSDFYVQVICTVEIGYTHL